MFEHIFVIFITLIMERLFLPLLVSVTEIKTLEYHNYIEIISEVSYNVYYMSMRLKIGIKSRLTEPFQSFAPNTHKLCILKYCINILLILQKNHFYPSTFILNNKIIH